MRKMCKLRCLSFMIFNSVLLSALGGKFEFFPQHVVGCRMLMEPAASRKHFHTIEITFFPHECFLALHILMNRKLFRCQKWFKIQTLTHFDAVLMALGRINVLRFTSVAETFASTDSCRAYVMRMHIYELFILQNHEYAHEPRIWIALQIFLPRSQECLCMWCNWTILYLILDVGTKCRRRCSLCGQNLCITEKKSMQSIKVVMKNSVLR